MAEVSMSQSHDNGSPADIIRLADPSGTHDRCLNCGATVSSKFCPDCGQSTKIRIPGITDILHDTLGAIFSYDAKVWRTLAVPASRPGRLTIDYVEGKRTRYLTPFQLFFWLQAAAFLSHKAFFSRNQLEIDLKTRALTIVGITFILGLAILNARKERRIVFHLIAGTHLWSFLMLSLWVTYTVVPLCVGLLQALNLLPKNFDTGALLTPIVQLGMVVYIVPAIRLVYGLSWFYAIFETVALFGLYLGVASIIRTS